MIQDLGKVEVLVCVLCDTAFSTQVMYDTATKRRFNHGAASAKPLHEGLCCKTCDDEKVIPKRIARVLMGLNPRGD